MNLYSDVYMLQIYWIMSKRLARQKTKYSKLYNPNGLSLAGNNDECHEKMWDQKIQYAKHVQQQKQIDRILTGIIKERLFGQILSQDSRLSTTSYYTLDKLNKQYINSNRTKTTRLSSPLAKIAQSGISTNEKFKTIDVVKSKRKNLSLSLSKQVPQSIAQDLGIPFRSKEKNRKQPISVQLKPKRSNWMPKLFTVSKNQNFAAYFKELIGNFSLSGYDIRLTKQQILKYNKQKDVVIQSHLQKFLHFFSFPGSVNLRQYGSWIQFAANCSIFQSNFFIFQLLDFNSKGVVTTSDLFNILQEISAASSAFIEKQIYNLVHQIKQMNEKGQLQTNTSKPTVEQILLKNKALRLEDMRELLKESSKQLISVDIFKSTTYHKSMYALQHDPLVRQKLSQFDISDRKQNNIKTNQQRQNNSTQKGLKFHQFNEIIYHNKRPQLFLIILKLLSGVELNNFE